MQVIARRKVSTAFEILDQILESQHIFTEQAAIVAPYFDIEFDPLYSCSGAKLHDWMRKNIKYERDGWQQKVKTPYRFLYDGSGDCKSFSVFAFSVLQNLGYEPEYILSNTNGSDEPDHIWIRYFDPARNVHKYFDGTIETFGIQPPYLKTFMA